MQHVKIGIVSAINLSVGRVDVKFPDCVSMGLWLLDGTRRDTLTVGASVVCLFPTGAGEGVCIGRHYCKSYQPERG